VNFRKPTPIAVKSIWFAASHTGCRWHRSGARLRDCPSPEAARCCRDRKSAGFAARRIAAAPCRDAPSINANLDRQARESSDQRAGQYQRAIVFHADFWSDEHAMRFFKLTTECGESCSDPGQEFNAGTYGTGSREQIQALRFGARPGA